MDINDAIELFLEYKAVEEGLNIKSTIPDYKDDFKVFLKYFPNIKTVDDLNDELIDNFIYEQSLNDLKSSTISRRISTIKNFFLFLENEKIATNLVKEVILPKKEKHIPTFLSIDEIKNLLSVFDETKPTEYRDKTMVLVMYSAGLRVSELINLEKRSINFEEKLITLKGKGNKERFVPLNYIALEYLNNYLSQNKNNKVFSKSKYLFINKKDGKPLTRQYFFVELNKYAKRAGRKAGAEDGENKGKAATQKRKEREECGHGRAATAKTAAKPPHHRRRLREAERPVGHRGSH